MKNRKKQVLVYTICSCIVFAVAFVAFMIYKDKLNKTFTQIEQENLYAYSQTQYQEVMAKLDNTEATLQVVAQTLSLDESLGEDEIKTIMDVAGHENESFFMSYYSFETLDMSKLSDKDKELVKKLSEGEVVISDVEFDETFDANQYYYGMAVPVYHEKIITGFVRALLPYETLYTSNQTGFLRDQMGNFLIYNNGDKILNDENMIDNIEKQSPNKDTFKLIKKDMANGISNVKTVKVNNNNVCLSYFALPYNNWYIINAIDHNALSSYSSDLSSLSLLLITFFAGIAVFAAMIFIHLFRVRERKLQMESERFSLLINFSDTILCKYIYRDDVLLFTPNTAKILGIKDITIKHFIANNEIENFCKPEDAEQLRKMVYNPTKTNEMKQIEVRLKRKNGEYAWFIAKLEIEYRNKKPVKIIAKITDNSLIRKELDDLKELANFDGLTGLYRYPVLKEQIKQSIKEKKEGVLCIVDCDKFKEINDTYGHTIGDRCLALLAANLKDDIGANNLIGRYGGDEFVLYVTGQNDVMNIEKHIQHILVRISEIIILEQPDIKLSACIGATYTKKGMSYDTLFELSDKCLYEAKEKGPGNYCLKRK